MAVLSEATIATANTLMHGRVCCAMPALQTRQHQAAKRPAGIRPSRQGRVIEAIIASATTSIPHQCTENPTAPCLSCSPDHTRPTIGKREHGRRARGRHPWPSWPVRARQCTGRPAATCLRCNRDHTRPQKGDMGEMEHGSRVRGRHPGRTGGLAGPCLSCSPDHTRSWTRPHKGEREHGRRVRARHPQSGATMPSTSREMHKNPAAPCLSCSPDNTRPTTGEREHGRHVRGRHPRPPWPTHPCTGAPAAPGLRYCPDHTS